MKIGIIGAMAQEVEILANVMTNRIVTQIAHCTIYQGKIAGQVVYLLQSGIGKVASSVGASLLINHCQPDLIINTGSAGGVKEDLNVGDVVISTACVYHDVDVTAFGYAKGQLPACPEQFVSDQKLVEKIGAVAKAQGIKVQYGLIASGDSFINGGEALTKIKADFPAVLAVEMEAAAIAQVCYLWKVPFVVVRAISDNGNSKASISFEEFLPLASQTSSQMIVEFLQSLN